MPQLPQAPHVLVVDDEAPLRELVENYLRREGFVVETAEDGPSALAAVHAHNPDLIILDVMLPGLDGVEVCRRLRAFSDAYVLLLTARTEEIDKIVGLSVGADDYVTKPFSPRGLVARVKALLRRPRTGTCSMGGMGGPTEDAPAPPLYSGDLIVDEARHEATLAGEPIALTAREFALLAMLASHPRRVFTRAQLLERVWGDDYYDDQVVDVHIANLRKKLDDDPANAAAPHYIETVRGVGYRFGMRTD
jgi:two-component system alkaline phosphatase synthesis response regulator PhoP